MFLAGFTVAGTDSGLAHFEVVTGGLGMLFVFILNEMHLHKKGNMYFQWKKK